MIGLNVIFREWDDGACGLVFGGDSKTYAVLCGCVSVSLSVILFLDFAV